MIFSNFKGIQLKLRQEDGKTTVFDPIRKKWIVLTPEEHVRQYLIQYLTAELGYPAGMMAVEKAIEVGVLNKRFDIVVYDRCHKPWMLVECKAPEVELKENTLMQLLSYQTTLQSKFWVLTNGRNLLCADATVPHNIRWLQSLPFYNLDISI